MMKILFYKISPGIFSLSGQLEGYHPFFPHSSGFAGRGALTGKAKLMAKKSGLFFLLE